MQHTLPTLVWLIRSTIDVWLWIHMNMHMVKNSWYNVLYVNISSNFIKTVPGNCTKQGYSDVINHLTNVLCTFVSPSFTLFYSTSMVTWSHWYESHDLYVRSHTLTGSSSLLQKLSARWVKVCLLLSGLISYRTVQKDTTSKTINCI